MKKTSSSATLRGPRRCVCGKCISCIDNARWEWIFQEKYGQQERDYYAATREPRSSGVSAMAFADASIYACAEEGPIVNTTTDEEKNVERFFKLVRTARYTDKVA